MEVHSHLPGFVVLLRNLIPTNPMASRRCYHRVWCFRPSTLTCTPAPSGRFPRGCVPLKRSRRPGCRRTLSQITPTLTQGTPRPNAVFQASFGSQSSQIGPTVRFRPTRRNSDLRLRREHLRRLTRNSACQAFWVQDLYGRFATEARAPQELWSGRRFRCERVRRGLCLRCENTPPLRPVSRIVHVILE